MKMLKLADELALPLAVVTEKVAFLGRTGSGKTYAAMKLAELMLDAGAQVGALDPVGVWRALRVPAKKGGNAFEVVVFGGLYGDLPLEPTAGALIADVVCDRGLSFVLDVSQMIPTEQQRFVQGFGAQFFQRKKAEPVPTAVHLFMEECQEFIPENPSGIEATTLGVMQRLWKLGRNFGIGGSLISQRPQEIAKKALNMSGTLFAFQMTGPQERAAVKKWVSDHGIAADIEGVLQKLQRGHPHVEMIIETRDRKRYEHSGVVQIHPRVTADLSSGADVGQRAVATRPLTPIDVEQLKSTMSATIERAKADDPKELKRIIAERDKQIRELDFAKSDAQTVPRDTKPVEVLTDADRAVLKTLRDDFALRPVGSLNAHAVTFNFDELLSEFQRRLKQTISNACDEQARRQEVFMAALNSAGLKRVLEKLDRVIVAPVAKPPNNISPQRHTHERGPIASGLSRAEDARAGRVERARPAERAARNGDASITPVQQRILDALAELDTLGARQPNRELVALLAGYTHLQSKGFVNAASALSTDGLIGYPSAGTMTLTSQGATLAMAPDVPRTPAEVQHRVVTLLGGKSAEILKPLIAAYPDAVNRQDVAAAAGYGHLQSKGFVNAVSKLSSLGFVRYPDRGTIAASPVLFLEA